jgi:hypothetical protein
LVLLVQLALPEQQAQARLAQLVLLAQLVQELAQLDRLV